MISPQLLDFLANATAYPEATASVQVLQTHISVLALCDAYVYKVKKNLRLDFLDFSTLALRKHFCEEEIRLNNRLAPDMYLGLCPIYRGANGLTWQAEAGAPVVEYAVKMRRLPPEGFLPVLLPKLAAAEQRQLVERTAQHLALFYAQQPPLSTPPPQLAQALAAQVRGNFAALHGIAGLPQAAQIVQQYAEHFLEKNADLLLHRAATCAKDCHGDLHLDHFHLDAQGQLRIYDCIEFNPQFRQLDLAADVAFLAMDLDHHGLAHLAQHLWAQLNLHLPEAIPPPLFNFYKCYRACVRAKVAALKAGESEVQADEQAQSLAEAQAYLRLALRYALLGHGPLVLAFAGGIGTGKSTLAEQLAQWLGAPHFNTDVLRKQMLGLPLYQMPDEDMRRQIYTPELTRKTYDALISRGLQQAQRTGLAIVDGTFGPPRTVAELQARAALNGVRVLWVETYAPEAVVRLRLQQRHAEGNSVSDARESELDLWRDKPPFAPPKGAPFVRLDTHAPQARTWAALLQGLAEKLGHWPIQLPNE